MGMLSKMVFPSRKFTPADAGVNWEHVHSLVHGPGAWARNGAGEANSVVFSCLMTVALASIEPPLKVYRDVDGKPQWLHASPWQQLLNHPIPGGEMSAKEQWFWISWAKNVDGNAYLRKYRSGNELTGNVVALWPVSPSVIAPVTVKDSGDYISYYRQQTGPSTYEDVPVENIIHFRLGLDDQDHRKGLAPLKRLVRSIGTDDEVDRFVETLLRNFAMPGLIVRAATMMDKDRADAYKDHIAANFGNDKRGNIAVISKNDEISQFGFSPSDMDMGILRRVPEERISAVIGVPALLAGLGAGLDRATYANAKQMEEMFTERRLCPYWEMDAEKVTTSLRADFSASQPDVYCKFDLTDVRALQEDEDAKYKRLDLGVRGHWILPDEARSDVGLPPLPDGSGTAFPAPAVPAAPVATEQEPQETLPAEGNGEEPVQRSLPAWDTKAAARQFPELFAAMQDLARPAMESDLRSYFEGQRRRVRRNLTGQEEPV